MSQRGDECNAIAQSSARVRAWTGGQVDRRRRRVGKGPGAQGCSREGRDTQRGNRTYRHPSLVKP